MGNKITLDVDPAGDNERITLKSQLLMATAKLWSQASYSARLQVGCVISRNNRILSTGYNGRLPGEPNVCEDGEGNTRADVMHAEQNALLYCARHGIATEGAILHTTDSPCLFCARLIISAGISEVYYHRPYRIREGIELLSSHGVFVTTEVPYR